MWGLQIFTVRYSYQQLPSLNDVFEGKLRNVDRSRWEVKTHDLRPINSWETWLLRFNHKVQDSFVFAEDSLNVHKLNLCEVLVQDTFWRWIFWTFEVFLNTTITVTSVMLKNIWVITLLIRLYQDPIPTKGHTLSRRYRINSLYISTQTVTNMVIILVGIMKVISACKTSLISWWRLIDIHTSSLCHTISIVIGEVRIAILAKIVWR